MMKTLHLISSSLAVALALAGQPGGAQDYRRVPVTDPADLAALGFPADAENVFRIEHEQPRDPEAVRAGIGADPRGLGQNWSLLMGNEFVGIDDRFSRTATGFPAELVCQNGSSEHRARARVPLRQDRRLEFLDVWAYDASATANLTVRLVEDCSPAFSAGSPFVTEIGNLSTSGNAGYATPWIVLPAVYPDTLQCSYYVEADFGSGCPAEGTNLRLAAVRVYWAD